MRTLNTLTRGVAAIGAAGLLSISLAAMASAEPTDKTNDPAYWVAALEDEGFLNVECEKDDTGLTTPTWVADADYLLVVLKAGSDDPATEDEDESNTLFPFVEKGEELTTQEIDGKSLDISHIITCTGDEPEEPETPEEPEGPIVETDIVETGSATPAALGGVTVLAGLGLAAALRRKGQI